MGEFFNKVGKTGILFLLILLFSYLFLPSFDKKIVTVKIPRGANLKKISLILEKNKIVPNRWLFFWIVKILQWENDLKAGFYEFDSPNLISTIYKIKNGEVKLYKVTIPEGLPKWRVAEILEKEKITKASEFLETIDHPEIFYQDFPWLSSMDSLEGYLFPDTYYFSPEEDPRKVILSFLQKFEEIVLPIYREREKESSFSLHEIVILASIVEKEARVDSEKPVIAAVFCNRLERGMKLMADPTIKYALGNFYQRLSRKMLNYPSSYNTYLYPGLTPGPICNPGVESIRAVLYPAKVDYLYFVAKGDGTHKFSRTYTEHLEAVKLYQEGQRG